MTNLGMKSVKSGKSISSTNPDDYLFWSKYKVLKRLDPTLITPTTSDGIYTLTSGASYSQTITHSLGYYPAFAAYFQDANGNWNKMPSSSNDSYGTSCAVSNFDTNTISFVAVFGISSPPGAQNFKVRMYIFVDPSGY